MIGNPEAPENRAIVRLQKIRSRDGRPGGFLQDYYVGGYDAMILDDANQRTSGGGEFAKTGSIVNFIQSFREEGLDQIKIQELNEPVGPTPPPVTFPSCNCKLDVPAVAGIAAAFASDAIALSYLDGTNGLADCYGWLDGAPGGATFTSDNTTDDQLILSAASLGSSANVTEYANVAVADGAVLTISWVLGSSGTGVINILTCDEAPVQSLPVSGSTGTQVFSALARGKYNIVCQVTCDSSAEFTIVSSLAMVVNPTIASFLDGSDTWPLEQCPRLEWPLFFGVFANKTDATTALATSPAGPWWTNGEFNVSCMAVAAVPEFTVATASASGTTFAVKGTVSPNTFNSVYIVACVSLLKGAVLSVTGSATYHAASPFTITSTDTIVRLREPVGGATIGYLYFVSSLGNHVDTISGNITIPHTGRFYVMAQADVNSYGGAADLTEYIDLTVTFSCDLAMTVNPLVAVYDRDVDCFARLPCTP